MQEHLEGGTPEAKGLWCERLVGEAALAMGGQEEARGEGRRPVQAPQSSMQRGKARLPSFLN